MGLWGATSGVATLVGPLAGGLLVDGFGWEWIFFINIPVGIVALRAGVDPRAEAADAPAPFDILGVVPQRASALFLIVFGLQEGEHYDWGVIWGPITVWGLIIAGVIVLGLFIWTQAQHQERAARAAGAVPGPQLLGRRTSAIATVGFTVTSMSLPLMFFIQLARGLTPTAVGAAARSRWRCSPACSSPFAGRLLDRTDPRVPARARPAAGRRIAVLVLDAHERRHPDLDVPDPVGDDGHRQRRHVGTAGHHGDPQPADAARPAPAPASTTRRAPSAR